MGGRHEPVAHLGRVVGDRDQVHVVRRDLALGEHPVAQPLEQVAPVARPYEDDGEVPDLAGLDERERLEQLVEPADPAGEDHEPARVADEHDLAGEEVVELERDVELPVEVLLERQLDAKPNRQRAGVARAAVGGLHHTGPAAGDDGHARRAHQPRRLARQGVLGSVRRRPGRAEEGGRGAHMGERAEALLQLLPDALDPGGIREGREERLLLGSDELLVEGLGHARLGVLFRHRTSEPSHVGSRPVGVPVSAGYDASMRRVACLVGLLVVAGIVSEAVAQPRALLDVPRAGDVAVAGGEVLVAAGTARGGARLTAVPAVGGSARTVFEIPPRGRGWTRVPRLPSSAHLTALLVAFLDSRGYFRDWRVYAGPPAGPLALAQRERHGGWRPAWTPIDLDVHGDRLVVQEIRQPRFAFRLVARAPDGTAPPVPQGRFGAPTAVAGEQLAYLNRTFIRIVDWRTGRLSGSIELARHSGEIEERHLDMTEGARVVAAINGRLMTGAPGVPVQELPGSSGVAGLTSPRFAGGRGAALAPGPPGARP